MKLLSDSFSASAATRCPAPDSQWYFIAGTRTFGYFMGSLVSRIGASRIVRVRLLRLGVVIVATRLRSNSRSIDIFGLFVGPFITVLSSRAKWTNVGCRLHACIWFVAKHAFAVAI